MEGGFLAQLNREREARRRTRVGGGAKKGGSSGGAKQIAADGSIVERQTVEDSAAFRPGLLSLRAQKMHWSLADMNELDGQYTFTIKRHAEPSCARVSLDRASCNNFQQYCRKSLFETARCGILYGRYDNQSDERVALEVRGDPPSAKANVLARNGSSKNPKHRSLSDLDVNNVAPRPRIALVDSIYEPPQRINSSGFAEINTQSSQVMAVDAAAEALGMKRVGFIFSHPPRKTNGRHSGEDFRFTGFECIEAASQQLEATNGDIHAPFVTVKVSCDEQGMAVFDAFQLSPQCVEMVAEGALLPLPGKPNYCAVHETFTAVAEGKTAKAIDTDFFLANVPITSFSSPFREEFLGILDESQSS